jgi:GT2 family glycosyltransferase
MITFGICVSSKQQTLKVMDSIMSIDNIGKIDYEIITVGLENDLPDHSMARKIISPDGAWLPTKKNLIAKYARYDIVCIVHDYYRFDFDWFNVLRNYNRVNWSWDILQSRIFTQEGHRHSDWIVNQKYMDAMLESHPRQKEILTSIAPHENGPRWVCGLPYDVTGLEHIQYISGGYILAKKDVFRDVPLNESMQPGSAEDLEWSERVIEAGYIFNMVPEMVMMTDKPGKWRVYEMAPSTVEILRNMYEHHIR